MFDTIYESSILIVISVSGHWFEVRDKNNHCLASFNNREDALSFVDNIESSS